MGFSFEQNRKKNSEINIAFGEHDELVYIINDGPELEEAAKRITEMSKEMDGMDGDEASIKLCADVIDEILGDGAYDEIWGDEEKIAVEHLDVVMYIFEEIRKAREKRVAGYMKLVDKTNEELKKTPEKKKPSVKRRPATKKRIQASK